jgi:nucleosome binding factor SPN SPT16 subunit
VFISIAKILTQIKDGNDIIHVEILAQAKAKEPANDALLKFVGLYTSQSRVGTLVKETHTGKLVTEWQNAISVSASQPELVDMSLAVSTLMSVKDEEELVSYLVSKQSVCNTA